MLGFNKEITKELDLVNDKQEQKLRKLGFDWCDETPTVELAIKWFRVVKKCFIEAIIERISMDDVKYRGIIYMVANDTIIKTAQRCDYDYAKSVALAEAIHQYSSDIS